jgi:thiamine-phosphate pyrophosphorylase
VTDRCPAVPFPLLAISDRHGLRNLSLPGLSLAEWAAALARHGVTAIQLRDKDLPDGARFRLACELRTALPAEVRLLINGRVDLAIAAGADGVHLPADGLPTSALRQRFGAQLLLGRSTHRRSEVEQAAAEGADYVTFGPVFASPGKGPPQGLEALEQACRCGVPVLALGGVGLAELPQVAAAGAAGAAAIRPFHDLSRVPELVAAAREAFAS